MRWNFLLSVFTSVGALVLLAPVSVHAQPGSANPDSRPRQPSAETGDSPPTRRGLCTIGLAWPRCRTILAGGIVYRYSGGERTDGGDEHSLALDAGLVVNLSQRHGVSLGGSVYFGDEFARAGIRLGYRHYLLRWLAIDTSAGVLFPRGHLGSVAQRGTNLRLELNVADAIALGAEATRFDPDGSSQQTAVFATVRLGWAPLGFAALVALKAGG